MTVKEYNEWYRKYDNTLAFVLAIDHTLDKAGDEAKHQMRCIGWGEERKRILIDALESLKCEKKKEIIL